MRKMQLLTLILFFCITLLSCPNAAHAGRELKAQFGDWKVYLEKHPGETHVTAITTNNRGCSYLVSLIPGQSFVQGFRTPKNKKERNINVEEIRGSINIINIREYKSVFYVANMDKEYVFLKYPFKTTSETKGFARDMRNGKKMRISLSFSHGNKSYEFSLKGHREAIIYAIDLYESL